MPTSSTTRSELVLPPLSPVLVGRPYAAAPLLAAYAEQRGSTGIRQTDLNQSYIRHLFTTTAEPARQVADTDVLAAAERMLRAALPAEIAAHPEDLALVAGAARDAAASAWLFATAGLPAADDLGAIGDLIELAGRLPGLRDYVHAHYASAGVPALVGVSVPFATQLAPALVLADVVRALAPDVFVVLGGPLVSLLDSAQITELLQRTEVDALVRHEGEESFRRLHELPAFDVAHLAEVPALSYVDGDGAVVATPAQQPPPRLVDTGPHPLDPDYVAGAVELPVMVGRGCFYTCAFCDYIQLYERINFRAVDDVVASARLASARGTTRLHFVYEVMSLVYERKLARALVAADLGISWRGFQRVFGEMTTEDVRLLAESGCHRLDIGLEAADDQTLELMSKGYTRDDIAGFLTAFRGSDIQLLINIIVDYPGLTHERALAAARFLGELTEDIPDLHFEVLRFALGRNSAMHDRPADFGLRVIDSATEKAAQRPTSPTQVAFDSTWSMTDAEIRDVEAVYRDLNARVRSRKAARLKTAAPGRLRLADVPVVIADGYVRHLGTAATFEVPPDCVPMVRAYQRLRRERPGASLADLVAEPDVTAGEEDCLDVLGSLGLLREPPPRAVIRTGISSDRNFYRGADRGKVSGRST